MDFISELKWRGMIHDITPGTQERLCSASAAGYAGFDPTASSLHIGHLIPIMLLMHFQRAGHKPIALVGGATGMIGDPSGKSAERKLLSLDEIRSNQDCIKKQLEHFLDFSPGPACAEIVNNYDWFKEMLFLEFLRDVGKYLTVNYMVAKDSVKNRWDAGISFTEFSYQLLQAYDFYWLYTNRACILQIGGSDQWGNITSGTELVRRKAGGEAFALTCPLLKRSDGKKFGKSEGGESVWLDPALTSPYKFYQYWLNCTDEDAVNLLRIFTLMDQEQIEALARQHAEAPHARYMQKALARDVTTRVHSEADCRQAIEASEVLFGSTTTDALLRLDEKSFLEIFDGVPRQTIDRGLLETAISVVELLTEKSGVFPSKGEARRMIRSGGVSINRVKIGREEETVDTGRLLNGKYLLVQKGKKNYYLIIAG